MADELEADGFVYGPTPVQAAEHIERFEALRDAGAEGLPEWPVEWQGDASGCWQKRGGNAAYWRQVSGQDIPRLALRLVPLPALPPAPEVVVVRDANDAHNLIGRSIDGKRIDRAPTDEFGFLLLTHDSIDTYEVMRASGWPTPVLVDPEPPPAPEEPATVAVEVPRGLAERWAASGIDGPLPNAARAALAAEGDGR